MVLINKFKKSQKMKIKIWSILLMLTLYGCNWSKNEVKKNNQIESVKREQIKVLNDKLMQSIQDQDIPLLRTLMSDSLIKKSFNTIEDVIELLHSNIETPKYQAHP